MALNSSKNIARRIAVVTGTNRGTPMSYLNIADELIVVGIGFEICKQLSEKGVITIMTSRDEAKGKKAMDDLLNILAKSGLDAKEKLFYHPLDVVSSTSVEKFKKYLVDNFKQVDILVRTANVSRFLLRLVDQVNNAGIYIDKWNEASFKETMETNVYAPIKFTDAILPLMKVSPIGQVAEQI